jgi:uncharacterized membrane protein
MQVLYILCVWAHVFAVAFWVGAMFFGDPVSERFFSKLFEKKLGGVGWYAHGVLWPTGLFMLHYRGALGQLFEREFIASPWGRALWVKILLVLLLVVIQIVVGNRPSKVVYAYWLVAFFIIGISVTLVRPVLL